MNSQDTLLFRSHGTERGGYRGVLRPKGFCRRHWHLQSWRQLALPLTPILGPVTVKAEVVHCTRWDNYHYLREAKKRPFLYVYICTHAHITDMYTRIYVKSTSVQTPAFNQTLFLRSSPSFGWSYRPQAKGLQALLQQGTTQQERKSQNMPWNSSKLQLARITDSIVCFIITLCILKGRYQGKAQGSLIRDWV